MMCANGVRKVFFHAGMRWRVARRHGGYIFFEYGGAPRKMYPAVAVLARLLGPDFEFVRKWDKPEKVHAYEFRSRGRDGGDPLDPQGQRPEARSAARLPGVRFDGKPIGQGRRGSR